MNNRNIQLYLLEINTSFDFKQNHDSDSLNILLNESPYVKNFEIVSYNSSVFILINATFPLCKHLFVSELANISKLNLSEIDNSISLIKGNEVVLKNWIDILLKGSLQVSSSQDNSLFGILKSWVKENKGLLLCSFHLKKLIDVFLNYEQTTNLNNFTTIVKDSMEAELNRFSKNLSTVELENIKLAVEAFAQRIISSTDHTINSQINDVEKSFIQIEIINQLFNPDLPQKFKNEKRKCA